MTGTGFLRDERGVSAILAFTIVMLGLTMAVAYLQYSYVPALCANVESDQFQEMINTFGKLHNLVLDSVLTGKDHELSFTLGGNYPKIPFLVTPPDYSGLITTYDVVVEISNARAVGVDNVVNTVWSGASTVTWVGKGLRYIPNFIFSDQSELVYELGGIYLGRVTYSAVGGKILDGTTIYLLFLEGNVSDSSTTTKVYPLYAYSGGGKGLYITNTTQPITIKIKTALPESFWNDTNKWSAVLDPTYVQSINYSAGWVEITLVPGVTYRLISGVVSFADIGHAEPHYLQRVTPASQRVPAELGVIVKDVYNNPVPGVNVTFSAYSGSVRYDDGSVDTTVRESFDSGLCSALVEDITSGTSSVVVASITRSDGTTFEIAFNVYE